MRSDPGVSLRRGFRLGAGLALLLFLGSALAHELAHGQTQHADIHCVACMVVNPPLTQGESSPGVSSPETFWTAGELPTETIQESNPVTAPRFPRGPPRA